MEKERKMSENRETRLAAGRGAVQRPGSLGRLERTLPLSLVLTDSAFESVSTRQG